MNALDHALQPLAGLRLARLPRATRLCLEMLDRLDGGAIAVELPDGVRVRAGHGPLVAHLRVRDHAVFDEALARGVPHPNAVRLALERRREAPPPLGVPLPAHLKTRDVTVRAHPLAGYDRLLEDDHDDA